MNPSQRASMGLILAVTGGLSLGCEQPTYVDMYFGTEAGAGFEVPVRDAGDDPGDAAQLDATPASAARSPLEGSALRRPVLTANFASQVAAPNTRAKPASARRRGSCLLSWPAMSTLQTSAKGDTSMSARPAPTPPVTPATNDSPTNDNAQPSLASPRPAPPAPEPHWESVMAAATD